MFMYISNILFVLAVVILIETLPEKIGIENRVCRNVISSYYEIYLLQNAMMIVFSSFSLPFAVMWMLTMLSTVFVGVYFHLLNNRISTMIFK